MARARINCATPVESPQPIDAAALTERSVYLNGGQRGLQIELDPNDAVSALDAVVQALTVE